LSQANRRHTTLNQANKRNATPLHSTPTNTTQHEAKLSQDKRSPVMPRPTASGHAPRIEAKPPHVSRRGTTPSLANPNRAEPSQAKPGYEKPRSAWSRKADPNQAMDGT